MSEQKSAKRINDFANNVYVQLSQGEAAKQPSNIVFSPYSMHACIAMAMLGADGDTQNEIKQGLGFNTCNKAAIAESYYKVLKEYEKSNVLRIGNKIYVMEGLTVKDEYNDVMENKFLSKTEAIDFSKSEESAKTINGWVEGKTNNNIKDLIPAQLLSSETQMVLVNAIYFKGEWVNKFPKSYTQKEDFFVYADDVVQVDMMELRKTKLMFADLQDLNASAIKMEYKDSDLFMLVLLPNEVTGLRALEEKLKSLNMADIIEKMQEENVNVKFPKFKAEYEIELAPALQELGMKQMFTDQANFKNMLQNEGSIKVSHVRHKAYIDVNEEGTEAAAATGAIATVRSSQVEDRVKFFIADHPFYYAIINANGYQFFVGKYEKPGAIEAEADCHCNANLEKQNEEKGGGNEQRKSDDSGEQPKNNNTYDKPDVTEPRGV